MERAAVAAKTDLIILDTSLNLLAEWLPADGESVYPTAWIL